MIDGLTVNETAYRAILAKCWQNWVFNGVQGYVAAGFVKETLKCLPILYAQLRGTPEEPKPRSRAYVDYAPAAGMSFSMLEGITCIYLSLSCEVDHDGSAKLLLVLFERVIFGTVGYLSFACLLIALQATKRDFYGDRLSF